MALEGQTFQFNMGAADPLPTKMDISLDDMIKQVSGLPTRAQPSLAPASPLGFLSLFPHTRRIKNSTTLFFFLFFSSRASDSYECDKSYFLWFSQTNGVRFAFAGIQGGSRKEEGCCRREGQEGGTFRLSCITDPPPLPVPPAFQEGFLLCQTTRSRFK